MCTASLVMAGFSMGSTLAGIQSKNKGLTTQAQQLASLASRQVRSDLDALELQRQQKSSQITLEQVRRLRQGLRERSTIASRLADSGVAGGTTVRDAVASVIQEEMDVATLETNKSWVDAQSSLEKRAAVARGQSQINQAQGLLDQRQSTGASVLQLISAGVSGYSQGAMLEPMFAGTPGRTKVIERAGTPEVDAQGFWK